MIRIPNQRQTPIRRLRAPGTMPRHSRYVVELNHNWSDECREYYYVRANKAVFMRCNASLPVGSRNRQCRGMTVDAGHSLSTLQTFSLTHEVRMLDEWSRLLRAQIAAARKSFVCRHTATGYTYAIQATGGGLVKIGRSRNPLWRATAIQSSSPVILELVTLAQDTNIERIWHRRYAEHRVNGEWFAPIVADMLRTLNSSAKCIRCLEIGNARPPWETAMRASFAALKETP